MTNERWTKHGAVAAGGTVFAGASDQDGRLLIAASAGIFAGMVTHGRRCPTSLPSRSCRRSPIPVGSSVWAARA
ncbi:MAG: hypothetical protein U0521_09450 [Anaerolineae bacterium]